MANEQSEPRPAELDVVALLRSVPTLGLHPGQVGTVVELLEGDAVLVEFSDNEGRAYAVTLCPSSDLLVLRTMRQVA